MNPVAKTLLVFFFLTLLSFQGAAQCTNESNGCTHPIPHLLKFGGTLKNFSSVPPTGVVAVQFVIYEDSTGGTPLWQEVQNTQVDAQGHYDVLLGVTSNEGIPVELFKSGEPRWLGILALLPGREEEARVKLVSVPYSLEAENAQTLGGLPPSAFVRAIPGGALTGPAPAYAPLGVAGSTAAATNAATFASRAAGLTSAGETINTIPKFAGAGTLSDSQIVDQSGSVSLQNLSNVLFADRFSGGVSAAITACPSNGCIIYAVAPNVNLNLGNIDPGTKAITIYLGPYTYTVNQVMLRKSLKIIGMGGSGTFVGNGTILQSVNGNNPVFVIPQTNNDPATNVELSGFRLYGSAGNTSEDGFFLDTSSTVNTGLWYSTINDINLEGFAGIGIHVKGRTDNFGAASQWLLFNNVVVYRTPGGGNALRLEGAVFELRFRNCQFDGQALGDGTNIYMGGLAGGIVGYPISIVFEGLVSQTAGLAVQIDGGVNLIFYGAHHEKLWAGYQITNNTNIGTHGLTITDSYFAGNVGVNSGTGYDLNIMTTNAEGIVFANNELFGNPDAVVKAMNFASVAYRDNLYHPMTSNVPPTSGLTMQVAPATTINIQGVHSVGLNPSTTPITTIQSSLGPGEMVTFFTFAGPAAFGSGGNIDLMGMSSLTVNGTVTLIRTDLGGPLWKVVSRWSPALSGGSQ